MAYTKNQDPWAEGDLVTTAIMDNFETIYAESSTYLVAHNHDDLYPTKIEMRSTYWYAGNCGSESGADADFLYKSTGNLHAASFAGLGVATGLIVLWYGSVASIPDGWQLCNGTGVVDLRGKFPVGAGTGSAYSVGDTGGSNTFSATGTVTVSGHAVTTAEMGAHSHTFGDQTPTYGTYPNVSTPDPYTALGTRTTTSGTTASAGSGSAHGHSSAEGTSFTGNEVDSLPFCLALCYIQKI